MLRPDAGIIQPGGNRIHRCNLPVFILQEQGFHTVEDAFRTPGNGSRCPLCIHAFPGRFHADEAHILVRDEIVEDTHGVGPAPHTGDDRIRQPPFFFQQLGFHFFPNHLLEVPYHFRVRMGPHNGA